MPQQHQVQLGYLNFASIWLIVALLLTSCILDGIWATKIGTRSHMIHIM